jgi:hypothetical protein
MTEAKVVIYHRALRFDRRSILMAGCRSGWRLGCVRTIIFAVVFGWVPRNLGDFRGFSVAKRGGLMVICGNWGGFV